MNAEVVKAIIEAAGGDASKAEAVSLVVDAEVKKQLDAAKGVEDVTAGLKSALAKKKEALDAFTGLGTPDEIRTRSEELAKLKAELEAADHGVDNDAVEKLANERADRMARQKVADANTERDSFREKVEALTADRELLIGRLESAWRSHDLWKNGGAEVDPFMWRTLQMEAGPYYRLRDNGADGEGHEWWRSEEPPQFQIQDPRTRELMTGDAGAMTPAEFLKAKRLGDWKPMWPLSGKGGGGTSGEPAAKGGQEPLDPEQATSHDYLDRVLTLPGA